ERDGIIMDDEPHVSIDYDPVSVTEGNTGTTSAVFTVRLSSAYDVPVDVTFSTQDYSATASGGDYQARSGTLTFATGDPLVKTIAIAVIGDRLSETREAFFVVLTGSPVASFDSRYGLGLILDDEPHVTIDYGPVSVSEGNSGTTNAVFTVHLSAAYDAPVT